MRTSKARWRAAAADLAANTATDLIELCCLLPIGIAAARLARRATTGRDASDATAAVAAEMAHEFASWPSATTIDTLPTVDELLPAVLDRIAAPHGGPTPPLAQSAQ